MGNHARLTALAVVMAVVAACTSQGGPSTAVPVRTIAPEPSAALLATPNPCLFAVTRLGTFTGRIAGDLAALRPLVVSRRFNAADTASAARMVSATLTAYDGVEQAVRACSTTADLSQRVEVLRSRAEGMLTKSLTAGLTDPRVEREAAASLLGLLPEVVALSKAAKGVADGLGVQVAVATVPKGADQPLGSLAPLPAPTPKPTRTPKPTPTPKLPTAATIKASFFGSGVRVTTYRVTGGTPNDISHSVNANGLYNKWIGGHAAGLTTVASTYRFVFSSNDSGECQILVESTPAIVLSYTVTLPRWTPPSGTSPTTIQWWNGTLTDIATHEKVHVDLYKSAAKRLNSTLAASTCANAQHNLNAVWNDVERQNCEFDMREYGSASGLSLKSCLAQ